MIRKVAISVGFIMFTMLGCATSSDKPLASTESVLDYNYGNYASYNAGYFDDDFYDDDWFYDYYDYDDDYGYFEDNWDDWDEDWSDYWDNDYGI